MLHLSIILFKLKIELFDTYEEAEERKRIIEEKQNINCKISRQKIEIEEEQYSYLKIFIHVR